MTDTGETPRSWRNGAIAVAVVSAVVLLVALAVAGSHSRTRAGQQAQTAPSRCNGAARPCDPQGQGESVREAGHSHAGGLRIAADPPLLVPLEDLVSGGEAEQIEGRSTAAATTSTCDSFWDWKAKPDFETMLASNFAMFSGLCGRVLARSHARSGDAIAIASYLGLGDAFDRAIAAFAEAYGDQTERDHEALLRAVRAGRLVAEPGV